ncbi:MAG: hypothetical protein OHK0012_20980 [Synechococcales cyanobacterium]
MVGEKILIVEDEKVIARDLSSLLKKLGYTVVAIAGTFEEAVARATEHQPDVVMMDIVLKGEQTGIETAAKLKEFGIPVIFLTAYADHETLEKAKETEPLAYIVKPFEPRDVQTTLEIALHHHRLVREREANLKAEYSDLQQEARFFQRFANVKDKMLSNLLSELSDPFSSLSMVIQILMESPLANRYAQYLDILKAEFSREMKLVDQVAKLQAILTPENVGFLDEFSLLAIEGQTKVDEMIECPPSLTEPVRFPNLMQQPRLVNRPLNQTDLAKRLDVVVSAISYWKQKSAFTEWSRSKDPDGFGWEYNPEVKLFYPKT